MIPFFAFNIIARIMAATSILIIIIKYFKVVNKYFLLTTLFFIIYTLIVNTVASQSGFLLRHLQLYIFLILILISSIVLKFSLLKKEQLLIIILSFNIIALIGTYFGLLVDSHAARSLAKSGDGALALTQSGVGGYGVIYMNALIYPILFFLKKTKNNKWIKFLAWINIVFAILVILIANFLIAIIVSVFQLFILFILSKKSTNRVLFILIFMVGIFFIFNNIDKIERLSYPLVEGTSLGIKHTDIFNTLNGNSSEINTITLRSERYERSLRHFFFNPLIGKLSFDDLGKHSSILDIFAQFGIFIGILFISLLRKPYLNISKKIPSQYRYYFVCLFWATIILGLFNNFAMHNGIIYLLLACSVNMDDKGLITI
jgi:hypothetical protein